MATSQWILTCRSLSAFVDDILNEFNRIFSLCLLYFVQFNYYFTKNIRKNKNWTKTLLVWLLIVLFQCSMFTPFLDFQNKTSTKTTKIGIYKQVNLDGNKPLHKLNWHKYTVNDNRNTREVSSFFFFISAIAMGRYYDDFSTHKHRERQKKAKTIKKKKNRKNFYFNDSLFLFGFWMKWNTQYSRQSEILFVGLCFVLFVLLFMMVAQNGLLTQVWPMSICLINLFPWHNLILIFVITMMLSFKLEVWPFGPCAECVCWVPSAECQVCQNRSLYILIGTKQKLKNRQTHITRLLTTHRSVFGLFHSLKLFANTYGRLEKEQCIFFSSDKQEHRKIIEKNLVSHRFNSSMRVWLLFRLFVCGCPFFRRFLSKGILFDFIYFFNSIMHTSLLSVFIQIFCFDLFQCFLFFYIYIYEYFWYGCPNSVIMLSLWICWSLIAQQSHTK